MASYTVQLKERYKYKWPPYISNFTNLGYVIHKFMHKRSGMLLSRHMCDTYNNFDTSVTVDEEISNIFLPVDNNECPQIILIEGPPGIGKTMLMREIRNLWSYNMILNEKKVLLYFYLRHPAINQINSIEDMFYHSCESREAARSFTKYFVKNNGQDLVILLDGLNENLQAMQIGSFLNNIIIQDKVFINACIVITSRPHSSTALQQFVSYRVEIIGFTDKRRQQFVQENLQENAVKLQQYLKNHEMIDTLCYNPLNLSTLVSAFKKNIHLQTLPTTQTELTKLFVSMTVLHELGMTKSRIHLANLPKPYNEIFYYLSELAYYGLVKNKLTFTDIEIRRACPVSTNGVETIERAIINGLGLLQTDDNSESPSSFTHYSVQELLAAWYIAFSHRSYFQKLPVIQEGMQKCLQISFQLKVLKDNFWKGYFINMWSFYIGLTGGEDFAFKHFLSGKMLCSYMQCKRLYSHHNTTSSEITEHVNAAQCTVSKNILKNKIKTLLLYYLLQEAPDNEMIEDLDSVVTQKMLDVSGEPLGETKDLYLLGYILSRPYLTKQWKVVDISSCEIDDEKFKVLHEVLTRNDGRPKPEIEALKLSGNKLKSSCSIAVAHLVCSQKIAHLYLSNNFLTDLVPFKNCGDFLRTLDISNNDLGNEKALELFTSIKFLRRLRVLKLNHNGISNEPGMTDAIGLALCYCNSLEKLELDGNSTEFVDEAMLIFQAIKKIRSSNLNVLDYSLTNEVYAFIKILKYCDQIEYYPNSCLVKNKIRQSINVDLSSNGLKDVHGHCLGQHLHLLVNLKTLDISENNISDKATKSLATGMLLTPKLKEFIYDKNLFSEDSTMIFEAIYQLRKTSNETVFKCAPSKIKALVFTLNCINDNEEKLQSSDIVSTIKRITELNLSHNEPTTLDYKLTSEDLNELCTVLRWFKQLKVLDVRNNNITDEAKESITKIMLQISTLNNLKLIGNPIFDNKLTMAVFDTIANVREKRMQSIVCNDNDSSHIECLSLIYIMDCISQLEDQNCSKLFNSINILDVNSKLNHASIFLEYLSFLPFLRDLKINNVTCITDCGMNQLSKYVSHNRTLTTLDLSFCNIKSFDFKNKPSIYDVPLKILKFNYSSVTDKILLKLSQNMLMFTDLNQFEIAGNCFGDKGISCLYDVLSNYEKDQLCTIITSLNLANNQLTSSSAIQIIKIVALCQVRYLNISDNYLESIFLHFENCTITTLEELNISANNLQKCNAIQFAKDLSYLKSCSSLKKLNISNNCIDETAIDEIYCSFMKCIHFEEVICNENPAENEIELAFHLVHNQHSCVKSINFKERPGVALTLISKFSLPYTDTTRAFVTFVETQISQVKLIDFSCNNMNIDENFVCVLQNCVQVEDLNLENNNITNDTFKYLAMGYLFTGELKLQNLHLKGNPCMDNPKNVSVLQMIEMFHLNINDFECPPAKFESFLTVIELVDSVSKKLNHVAKTISLIKSLSVCYYPEPSDSFNQQNTNQISVKLQSCDVRIFCNYLKYFKSLESINMIGNNIEEDVKDELAITILKNCNIIEIHLEGNPVNKTRIFDTIGEMRRHKSAYAFKNRPEMLKGLVNILMYINDFDDKTCDITENIEDLDISQFYQPTPDRSQHASSDIVDSPEEICIGLIYHLKLFGRLKTLNLSRAYVTLDALQELSRFLQYNDTLLQLDISHNNIQAEGALIVLNSLHTNATLMNLNLSNNAISKTECDEITTIIDSLPNINVNMGGNELSEGSKTLFGLM